MFEWAYSGANKDVPRNVGPECAYYLSPQRQIIETIIVTTACIYIIVSIENFLKIIIFSNVIRVKLYIFLNMLHI